MTASNKRTKKKQKLLTKLNFWRKHTWKILNYNVKWYYFEYNYCYIKYTKKICWNIYNQNITIYIQYTYIFDKKNNLYNWIIV